MTVTRTILQPSIRLMSNLSFRPKFAIIVALLLAPLALVGYFFIKEINISIAFAANERSGTSYISPVQEAYNKVAVGSITSEPFDLSRSDVKRLEGQSPWLKGDSDLQKALQATNHSDQVNSLKALIQTVGNNSQLVLDPDIDSYYTMDAVVFQIPNALAAVETLSTQAINVAKRKRATTTEKVELAVKLADLRRSIGNVSDDLGQAKAVNDSLSSLEGEKEKVQAAFTTLAEMIDKGIIASDRPQNSSTEVRDAAVELVNATGSYHKDLMSTLDRLLVVRQQGFEGRKSMVSILTILSLVAAGYLLIGVYVGMMGSLAEAGGASQRLSQGDANQAVRVLSRDEVGALSKDLELIRLSFKKVAETATEMAHGNLTVQVDVRGERDELGFALTRMVESLRTAVATMKAASEGVRDASQELANSASEGSRSAMYVAKVMQDVHRSTSEGAAASSAVAIGCEEQAAATVRANDALHELFSRVEEVQNASKGQRKVAEATHEAAEVGGRALRETLERVQMLQAECLNSSNRVQALGDMGNAIGSIVGTIGEIADQTNLLALNAAIEAARAGEHGRGFAVVADEVRKLAERSRISSEEIAKLIGQVRTEVANSLKAIENTAREAAAGTELSKTASAALEAMIGQTNLVVEESDHLSGAADSILAAYGQLADATSLVASRSEQNAAAAEELSASTNEVADATGRVSHEAERQAQTVRDIEATADRLAASAEEMQDLVSQFRLPETETRGGFLRIAA